MILTQVQFPTANIRKQQYDHKMLPKLSISHPTTLRATFDWQCANLFTSSVQTNIQSGDNQLKDPSNINSIINSKNIQQISQKRNKKITKKQLFKNKAEFKQIIDSFFQEGTKYEPFQQKMTQILQTFPQAQFKSVFDTVLQLLLVSLQDSVWQYTHSILFENPLYMSKDNNFFLSITNHLFKYFKIIQTGSIEAEKIIQTFLKIDPNSTIKSKDLRKRVFRYFIGTHQTMMRLLHLCDQKITISKAAQREKIEIMISNLKNFRQNFDISMFNTEQNDHFRYQIDDDDSIVQPQNEQKVFDSKSTGVSQLSEQPQQIQKLSAKKKRKNKAKKQAETQQDKCFNFLQNLKIDHENRIQCRLEQSFLQKILCKIKPKIQNPSILDDFEILNKKLISMEPVQKISQRFKGLH